MEPLGLRIARGEGVIRRLVTGKSWKKWAVLPVSAMTLVEVLDDSAVGGSRCGSSINSVSTNLHSGVEAGEVRLESGSGGGPGRGFPRCQPLRRRGVRRPNAMRSLPPIIWAMVASVL